ncbi:50S ribosomal protein L25/general stress protein Ctc [Legionella israelensis]|uniref:50S ribosomal protein L25/general stress protein Ctc n=1 Tax=Legionella israelensis TaxID=454 RepID=UPI0011814AAD|nr:50S ribosomal protein L25/general stress protein Ctc [Legionella israelensis]QDP71858.1 50S ribosomal protein L25/general stress protein Ctc [Legionella israelensis]
MSTITLEAETRTDMGKGASRRLRRLEDKVPGILYGGDKKPVAIHLTHKKVLKALETESIYSSVFDLKVDGKAEQVILKDLQRHPYKPVILHMDLQRVSAKYVLEKMVPLHFINEESAKGVKAGGILTHSMTQVEVRCQARYLPEYIEVDMANVAIDDVVHLSDLKLPKGVELTVDVSDHSHDLPVASIHMPKASMEEIEEEQAAAEEEKVEAAAKESIASDKQAEESAE